MAEMVTSLAHPKRVHLSAEGEHGRALCGMAGQWTTHEKMPTKRPCGARIDAAARNGIEIPFPKMRRSGR